MKALPRIAVFVSGGGRSLENLAEKIRAHELEVELALVVSNAPKAFALERAKRIEIPSLVLDPERKLTPEEFSREAFRAAEDARADLVVLAGFLRLLVIPEKWIGRVLNIHPALLPAFGGKGFYGDKVHAAVLASGAKESGCTVHYVTNEYDKGPIVLQRKVPVLPNDDVHTLATRVFEAEKLALPEAIREHFRRMHRREGLISFVLLPAAAPINGKGICSEYMRLFPEAPSLRVKSGDENGAELDCGGFRTLLTLAPHPIPDGEAEACLQFSAGTEEGDEDACAAHHAHLVVLSMNPKRDNEGRLRHMRVLAATLEAHDGIAVYDAPATHMRAFFVDEAVSDFPALALLALTRIPDGGGRCGFIALDPGRLDGPDLIVTAGQGQELEAYNQLLSLSWYVMQLGRPLIAGETVGSTDDQRLLLRETRSPLDPARSALRFELPAP